MKKRTIIAIAGFLIVVALFGYSYHANKAAVPPTNNKALVCSPTPTENKVSASSTASTEKKAAGRFTTTDKNQASLGPTTQPESNATNKSTPKTQTSTAVSNEPAVEDQAPINAAEAIEQAKKNGESMWLLFRSTTCIPCVEMQKLFDQVEPAYKGRVHFIAIDVNDRNNIELLNSFKIQYIPATFIIDGSGNISYQNVGVIPIEDLKGELNKVVK